MTERKLDEKLTELQSQIARKQQLEVRIRSLNEQESRLRDKVSELNGVRLKEQDDVERMEKKTFHHFIAYLSGNYEEKLDKENREACEAALRHETACQELEAVTDDLNRSRREMEQLKNCQDQYKRLLEEKKALVKASDSEAALEVIRSEEALQSLESKSREIREAMMAGESASRAAGNIMNSLDCADGWGTWDLIGGGLISGLAKHSALSEAQSKVDVLQLQLRKFRTELADVEIQADLQLQIDGFLQFADFFFDGIFADIAVLNRIDKSKAQVEQVKQQIGTVLAELRRQEQQVEREKEMEKQKIERCILDAGNNR